MLYAFDRLRIQMANMSSDASKLDESIKILVKRVADISAIRNNVGEVAHDFFLQVKELQKNVETVNNIASDPAIVRTIDDLIYISSNIDAL